MRRPILAALLTAMLAIGALAAAPTTQAQPLPQAATCGGVWVVVDYGSLGGVSTRCASSYNNGTGALRSAGFSPTLDSGMITKIADKPTRPDVNMYYWSYWHATRKSDGSYSGWSYSNVGANGYHPTKGNAEGWRYQSLSGPKVAPGAAPPKNPVATPKPTPTKTSSNPSSKPTVKPTATKKPSAPAKATSATPVPTVSATPTQSESSVAPTETATATELISTTQPADTGSPLGAIVAGGLVLAGGAGIGGWWWLKGRKR